LSNKPRAGKSSAKFKLSPSQQTFRTRGMYSEVTVSGFKLFDRVTFSNLGKINLLFGPNNAGKTSVLEAIYSHACGLNAGPFFSQVVLRRCDGILTSALDLGEKILTLFNDHSSFPYTFSINSRIEGSQAEYTVTSSFSPSSKLSDLDPHKLDEYSEAEPLPGPLATIGTMVEPQQKTQTSKRSEYIGQWEFRLNNKPNKIDMYFPPENPIVAPPFKLGQLHDILAHRDPKAELKVFSHLKRYRILEEFTHEMAKVFPEIKEIDSIPYPDGSQGPVYIRTLDEKLIPMFSFGDGARRWFHLIGHMLVNKNAVHLIEEIDSTFHPEAQAQLSRLLIRYANKFNNQLFITSHSIEFADNFLKSVYSDKEQSYSQQEDPVRVFTIKPSQRIGRPEIWMRTGYEAFIGRSEYKLELR